MFDWIPRRVANAQFTSFTNPAHHSITVQTASVGWVEQVIPIPLIPPHNVKIPACCIWGKVVERNPTLLYLPLPTQTLKILNGPKSPTAPSPFLISSAPLLILNPRPLKRSKSQHHMIMCSLNHSPSFNHSSDSFCRLGRAGNSNSANTSTKR